MTSSTWEEAVSRCLLSIDERDAIRMYASLRLGVPYAQVTDSQREQAKDETFMYRYSTPPARAEQWLHKRAFASELAPRLAIAWQRYVELFGEAPHGTEQQLAAMLELLPVTKGMNGA